MSFLIEIKSSERMGLLDLWRLIFKYTFDKKNCAFMAKQTIEANLMKWNDLIRVQKKILTDKYGPGYDGYVAIGKKGSMLDEIEYQVGLMCSWVVREERGEFQSKVEAYKRANIDYRLAEPACKVFPECNKNRNFARGRAALSHAMKMNPEDYK